MAQPSSTIDTVPLAFVLLLFLFLFTYRRSNSRKSKRRSALLFTFLFGVWFCYLDYRGWRINDTTLPRIVGVGFIGGSILGLFGVNIWRDGPLDP